mgnify:FL=1
MHSALSLAFTLEKGRFFLPPGYKQGLVVSLTAPVLQLMASAFAQSDLPGADQMAKVLTNPGKHHYAQWVEFRKRIEPLRSSLPEGVGDKLTFDAVADLIRVTRNEAGHPSGQ